MRLTDNLLFLLLCVQQSTYADSFDCSRSFCGCSIPATLDYETTIVDGEGRPIKDIEIICSNEKDAISKSGSDGKAKFLIHTQRSPGCQYARCTNIRFVDDKVEYEEVETTVFMTNGRKVVLHRILKK